MDEKWIDRVTRLRTWVRGGERAPHKPLLLLYVLGRLQRFGASTVSFTELQGPLDALLREFGLPRPRQHPEFPFFHLQNDGLWTVSAEGGVPDPPGPRALIERHAVGKLAPDFEAALVSDPDLLAAVARALLERNFPESAHEDICEAVGLDLSVGSEPGLRPLRDPAFRRDVLLAYEYRCAVCAFDGRIRGESVGLEAAHVRWWAGGGPNGVDNGLCLCTLHHKLYDRGIIGLTTEYRILVSSYFIGHSDVAKSLVLDLSGRDLLLPQPGLSPPATRHMAWHRQQVFKSPARGTDG